MIHLECQCGHACNVSESFEGTRVKCPNCGCDLALPDRPDIPNPPATACVTQYQCPQCSVMITSPLEEVGKTATCPSCGAPCTIPAPMGIPAGASRSRWSGLAITGFILSLAAVPVPTHTDDDVALLVIFLSIVIAGLAVIFSVVGKRQIASGRRQRGKGLSIAGLVIGCVDLLVYIVVLCFWAAEVFARRG